MSEEFDIEELLQTHLSEDHSKVPDGLFPNIEATILANEGRKKRFLVLWFLLGGLALLLSGIIIGSTVFQCDCTVNKANIKRKNLYYQNKTRGSNKSNIPTVDSSFQVLAENTDMITLEANPTSQSYTLLVEGNNHTSSNNLTKRKGELKQAEIQTNIVQESVGNDTIQGKNFPATLLPFIENKKADVETSSISNNTIPLKKINRPTLKIRQNPFINEPSNIDTKPVKTKSKTGIIAFAGPSVFNLSLFKPYFKSGHLVSSPTKSKGVEYGLGIYRKITPKISAHLTFNYSQKQSGFKYDLMVSESDYFDLYQNDMAVPLENLDGENSCNCFLLEEAELEYKISTIKLNVGGEIGWLYMGKTNFVSQLNIATNLYTKYTTTKASKISFPQELNENLNVYRLNLGTGISYQITSRIEATIIPSFSFNWINTSALFSDNYPELYIPVQLKLNL